MAWNGGVSLAIWMGGAAVELDAARRAHLGKQKEEGNERSVYHALTQAFDRELVIDILAGASAGGINGALLGAVITKRRELRPNFLRQRWLELGDLSALLRPLNEAKPVSLMRGDYFRDQIRKTFRAVTGEGDDGDGWLEQTEPSQEALLAGEVVLDIQATNVAGAQRGFSDEWRQTLYAREYRAPIRFRQPDDYSSDALAAAARASASFPVAFEPSALINKSARLGGFPGVKRWAIDGGLLENAPIRPAIDLIPTRQADRPVTRFVCYVNAAPTNPREDEDDPEQPALRKVLGDVINLPREGRFIDQLVAIEDAAQRTTGVKAVATGLLALPQAHLQATAEALLDAYRKPRTILSLRELMAASTDAGEVAAMLAAIDDELGKTKLLPWIPRSLKPPTQASEWRWGIRPAQRVVLLQLDLLRVAADHDDPAVRAERAAALLEFRKPLNKALARLEDARQRFASSPAIREAAIQLGAAAQTSSSEFDERLDELDSLLVGFRCEAFDAVSRGAETLHKALTQGPVPIEVAGMKTLFGKPTTGEFGAAHLDAFLERALCIEVVRRAFAPDHDMEPTQDLHFVQLTPLAPVRFFTRRPLRNEGPNSGREKLTGLNLAHFSAFYRRSWRANDFMWGRLDAATRIVDLMVSSTRNVQLALGAETQPNERLAKLAEELVPTGGSPEAKERRQLVKEALNDAKLEWRWRRDRDGLSAIERKLVEGKPATELQDAVAQVAGENDVDLDDETALRELLLKAIAADLQDAKRGGFFTRVVCARAAHYEILRQELQPLAEATAHDGRLGCFTKPIRYDEELGTLESARALDAGTRLPTKLGSGVADESTSTLAVRTVSHAALVLISSLKAAGVPLGGTFGLLRAPFLSLAGITAEKMLNRGAALLAFVAGSFYLTTRAVTAKDAPAELKAVWSPSTVATLVAVFAVLALVALPLWRAWRASYWQRKLKQGLWGTGMLLASGLATLLAAFFAVGFGNALTSTKGFTLPGKLAAAIILLPLGGAAVIRFVRLPSLGRRRLEKLATRPSATAVATIAVALLLIRETLPTLRSTVGIGEIVPGFLDPGNWRALVGLLYPPSELWDAMKDRWREAAVIAAYASVPLAALYGLHGFVRRAIDVARVRVSSGTRGPVGWLRQKFGRFRRTR